ncbi:Dopamine N-acetyltransferase-like protein [Aphelenchoides fujianensis]|nr:Dopamine N-acetyltransferase-like protein [Aphelenchoides fujianensis]
MTPKYVLPQVRRETVFESFYVPKLDTTVRLVIAKPEDADVLTDYICDQFAAEEPLNFAAGLTAEELRKVYAPLVAKGLERPLTILATDCFEIVGVVRAFVGRKGPKRTAPLLDDYAEKIAASTAGSLGARQIEVFVGELKSWTPNHLPDDCEEFFRIGFFSVLPDYQGSGLGKRLWFESLDLARRSGFRFVESGCTSRTSTAIAKKFGMDSICTIPYANFCADGRPVFSKVLRDGSREANLMFGSLQEIAPLLDEIRSQPVQLPEVYRLEKRERKVVDPAFVLLRLDRSVQIVVAEVEDHALIQRFMRNEIIRQSPMSRSIQFSKEENDRKAAELPVDLIAHGMTLLALDDGKLCGILINIRQAITHGPPVSEEPKTDYTAEIDVAMADGLTFKCAVLRVYFSRFIAMIPQKLPVDCSDLFILYYLGVHPDYCGNKLGEKLWMESLKLAKQRGFRFTQSLCSAAASSRIASKTGMKAAFSQSFADLHYKGAPVFADGRMYDGGDATTLFIGDLDEMQLD